MTTYNQLRKFIYSPHAMIDRSATASKEEASELWFGIVHSENTRVIEEQTNIQTFLNTIWNNTQHIWDQIPFEPIVKRAVSSNNFTVLNFFLEKNAKHLCQTLRLMPIGRGIDNPLHVLFKKAVQNNEVYFVEHSLPYVPRTDGRGRNFLHKQIWIAAQNANTEGECLDDPLFVALWNGSSDACKELARHLAAQECDDAPQSSVRNTALQLIEERLSQDQKIRLNDAIVSDYCDTQHNTQRKM